MPVSPSAAYSLLHAFGMLEFELKRIPRFLGIGYSHLAKVNWDAVDRAVGALDANDFLDQLSARSRSKLLAGGRNRPKVQVVQIVGGENVARFEKRGLPRSDAQALLTVMRRVRNNLFHGGKEDPLEEPREGDDEEWALAAREVAEILLTLIRNGQLRFDD